MIQRLSVYVRLHVGTPWNQLRLTPTAVNTTGAGKNLCSERSLAIPCHLASVLLSVVKPIFRNPRRPCQKSCSSTSFWVPGLCSFFSVENKHSTALVRSRRCRACMLYRRTKANLRNVFQKVLPASRSNMSCLDPSRERLSHSNIHNVEADLPHPIPFHPISSHPVSELHSIVAFGHLCNTAPQQLVPTNRQWEKRTLSTAVVAHHRPARTAHVLIIRIRLEVTVIPTDLQISDFPPPHTHTRLLIASYIIPISLH